MTATRAPEDRLPPLGDGFEWVRESWGPALVCRPLAALGPHRFSTRALPLPPGDQPAGGWRHLAEALGVPIERLVLLRQVHGATAVVVRRPDLDRRTSPAAPMADIVATDDPQCAIAVRVADCVPLLLADPQSGAVAAAHVGWRGLVAKAPAAAARSLVAAFDARPGDLVAAIGPAIGPCCYVVGAELREVFRAAGHPGWVLERWFVPRDGAVRLDLVRAVRDMLETAGVDPHRIFAAELCTATHRALFPSYRRDGGGAGRIAAIIRPRGAR